MRQPIHVDPKNAELVREAQEWLQERMTTRKERRKEHGVQAPAELTRSS